MRRLGGPGTVLLSAGDDVGASPVASALFHDEPTRLLLDGLGVRAAAAGNHEFDEGADELLRLARGGCHPVDGCRFRDPYPGVRHPVLSANVTRGGAPALAPSTVLEVGGVRLGVIGATVRSLPTLVSADALAGLQVGDEVEAIDRASAALTRPTPARQADPRRTSPARWPPTSTPSSAPTPTSSTAARSPAPTVRRARWCRACRSAACCRSST